MSLLIITIITKKKKEKNFWDVFPIFGPVGPKIGEIQGGP